MPVKEKEALAAFFKRINDDYRNRVRRTEYRDSEIKYDYLRLNCAKTIGVAFKLGAGYENLEVTSARLLSGRRVVAAASANIPTEIPPQGYGDRGRHRQHEPPRFHRQRQHEDRAVGTR